MSRAGLNAVHGPDRSCRQIQNLWVCEKELHMKDHETISELRAELAAYLKLGDETDAALTLADAELAVLRPIARAVAELQGRRVWETDGSPSLVTTVPEAIVAQVRAWRDREQGAIAAPPAEPEPEPPPMRANPCQCEIYETCPRCLAEEL